MLKAKNVDWYDLTYFRKWFILAGLTGIIGGFGSIVFNFLLNSSVHFVQILITNLPDPRLIFIIPAVGGLLNGILKYFTVPESFNSPCATDACIESVHHQQGNIKSRVPFVYMIAASLTIGSGGSSGRECPTAFIGSGLGSIAYKVVKKLRLNRLLNFKLDKSDNRLMATSGAASGLGAIFRAPFGSALFSSEALYTHGFEVGIIFPAIISAIISYAIFSLAYGFEPLYHAKANWNFTIGSLFLYLIIALICTGVGVLYTLTFHRTYRLFHNSKMPNYIKPALGGFLEGLLVLMLPQVWGMGYNVIQDVIDFKLALGLMLVLIVGKTLATSFTIGSGGSGGVIAPSLFVGALVGSSVGSIVTSLIPQFRGEPYLFAIIGMGAFFASVSKAPISTSILLVESTRNYSLLIPLLFANTLAYMASGHITIYSSQKTEFKPKAEDVFTDIKAKDIIQPVKLIFSPQDKLSKVFSTIRSQPRQDFPYAITNKNSELIGVLTWNGVRSVPVKDRDKTFVGDVMVADPFMISADVSAHYIIDLLHDHNIKHAFIIKDKGDNKLLGLISRACIISYYDDLFPHLKL